MQRKAKVNYLIRSDERQTYELDAGGVVGNILSPPHAETEIALRDERAGDDGVSFEKDGIALAQVPTAVTVLDNPGRRCGLGSETGKKPT